MTPEGVSAAQSDSRGDSTLIADVRRQMEAWARSTGGSSGAGHALDAGAPAPGRRPTRLEHYDLLHEIERGGQGVVYEAIQRTTRRSVAVKVMREGPFASRRERFRFEREIEILAGLKHPSIIPIVDSGEEHGCQFFVMDLARGETLDAYVAARRPPVTAGTATWRTFTRAVMELFVQVCDAVNAAHLAGVVHRDLKPSNIRVDDQGRPQVLDFGLAKRSSAAETVLTRTGQFVGTLPYASPEQAGEAETIDTRTDVYALGVLLYHALTGRFPYDVTGPTREVMERILHTTPVRPRALVGRIDEDLETIVLRALSKDPARRYSTAGDFGRDLQRCLAGRPIEARRESTAYVLRKLVARHKAVFALSVLAALAVVAGLVISFVLWGQAAQQRDRAIVAEAAERLQREQAIAALAEAEAARRAAERSAAESQAMDRFVSDMLRGANPKYNQGRELSVGEMLDRAAESLMACTSAEQDELSASFHVKLATSYKALGMFDRARSHYEEALRFQRAAFGADSAAALQTRIDLAHIDGEQGHFGAAASATADVLQAVEQLEPPDELLLGRAELQRGIALRESGAEREAIPILERAIERFRTHGAATLELGPALNALAVAHMRLRQLDLAEALFLEAYAALQAATDGTHVDLPVIQSNRATLAYYAGEYERADELYQASYARLREVYGEMHPLTATVANNIVAVLRRLKRLDEARLFGHEVLERRRTLLGGDHPEVATSLENLAGIYADLGDVISAEPLVREALEIRERSMPAGHGAIAEVRRKLGVALLRQKQYEAAEPLLLRAFEEMNANQELRARRGAGFVDPLIELYEAAGDDAAAAKWRAERAEFASP